MRAPTRKGLRVYAHVPGLGFFRAVWQVGHRDGTATVKITARVSQRGTEGWTHWSGKRFRVAEENLALRNPRVSAEPVTILA